MFHLSQKITFCKGLFSKPKGHLILEITNQLQVHIPDDLEYIFSKESEPTDDTLLALQLFQDDYPCSYHYKALNPTKTCPQTLIHVLPTKYDKPIPAIAFFDSRAFVTIPSPPRVYPSVWRTACPTLARTPSLTFLK